MTYGLRNDGGLGAAAPSIHFNSLRSDSSHTDSIVVPDAQLLFTAQFHRAGPDLVLIGHDGRHFIVPGYFASEHRPALVAPNGAGLLPNLIDLLAGSPAPNEYAQAQTQTAAPPDSIGKVQKVIGTATVVRNGVSVALNVGDVVYKSDVIVTGADSKCGLTFPDGTALELLANTRMALNEYSYDPHGDSNSALFTYVSGTFGFFAGKVAHSGNMKIDTPVATMGIRGTTGVMGQGKDADGNDIFWQVIYDDPGTTRSGAWDDFLRNPDGTVFVGVTVSQTDFMTIFTLRPGQPPDIKTIPLPDSYNAIGKEIIQELTDLLGTMPRTLPGASGSPEDPLLKFELNFLPGVPGGGEPFTYNYGLPGLPNLPLPPIPPFQPPPSNPSNPSNVFIWPTGSGTWPTGSQWNQGVAPTPNAIVIIESGDVQYDLPQPLTIFSLTVDGPGELDMIGGGLTVTDGLDVAGILRLDGDPPIFTSYGPSTIESGGRVIASGAGAFIDFMPDPSNPGAKPVIVDNFGTIAAKHGGEIDFIQAAVSNEAANAGNTNSEIATPAGRIISIGGDSVVDFTNSTLDNAGRLAARWYGEIALVDSSVTNLAGGRIVAAHWGLIKFAGGSVENQSGVGITAREHGVITFDRKNNSIAVANDAGGNITAKDCGIIAFKNATLSNDAGAKITAKDYGIVTFVETADSTAGITNLGTMAARHHGILAFVDVGGGDNNGVSNTGGTIEAIGCGAEVKLADTVIIGGTLRTREGGVIESVCGYNTLINVTLDGAVVRVDCDTTLALVDGAPLGSAAVINGTVRFEGGGTVLLAYESYKLVAGQSGSTLINDATIFGLGQIGTGDDALTFFNEGLLEARLIDPKVGDHGDTFTIATGKNTVTNDGVMQADRGTLLDIDSKLDNSGRIIAQSGTVAFDHNVVNEAGGLIEAKSGGTVTFDEVKITNEGCDEEDAPAARIVAKGEDSLVSIVDSTVDTHGDIAARKGGHVDIEDSIVHNRGGVIKATGSESVVELSDSTVDHGAISVTHDGLIQIEGDSGATFDDVAVDLDSHGKVEIASGSILTLEDGSTVSGGTLVIDTDSTLDLENGLTVLAGVDVKNLGGVEIDSSDVTAALQLSGGTTLDGNITVGPTGELDVNGATLDGASINDQGFVNFGGPVTLAGDNTINMDGGHFADTASGAIIYIADDTSASLGFTGASGALGRVDIESHATFAVNNAKATDVDFVATDGTFQIDSVNDIPGTIADFAKGDVIDLANLAFSPIQYDIWTQGIGGGTLAIYQGSTLEETLNLSGTYSQNQFELKQDGAGTDVLLVEPVLKGSTAETVIEGTTQVSLGVTDHADGTVTITGLPTDLSNVNKGTYTAATGIWTGTKAQFNDLNFTAGDEGTFDLVITEASPKTDPNTTTSETYKLTVTDAALTAGTVTATGGVEGVTPTSLTASFTDANPGDHHGDFTASIDWGDGLQASSGTVTYDSTTKIYSVAGSHTYAEDGSYDVTVTVNDDGGSATTITGTATVSSTAENPTLSEAASTISLMAQVATALGLTLTPADSDDSLTVTITGVPNGATFNAGTLNGSTLTITQAQLDALGGLGNLTMTAGGAGGTLHVTATNAEGGSASEDLTVNVSGTTTITSANALGVVTDDDSYLGNLILNGGFETWSYNYQTRVYTVPDWTFGGNFYYPPGVGTPAHSGGAALDVYNYNLGTGTASETFATDVGQSYQVTFYVYKGQGSTNSFSAQWNGTTEVSLINYANFGSYQEYQFSAVATSSTSTLQFDFNSGVVGYWFLDDVSVVPAGSSPGTETRTGTITFTDTDTADSHTVGVTPQGSGYLGTFTANLTQDSTGGKTGNVVWNYTVGDSALASLSPGQEVTQTYEVTVNGADSAPVQQAVTIQLVGIQQPTGFVFTPYTAGLSSLEQGDHLNSGGGGEIGTFTQSGGLSGDNYAFSIGGTGLSYFSPDGLIANEEILYTANTQTVPGGNPAKVYALTVTVTDTTNGGRTSALPFDVVVDNATGNTIKLESGIGNLGISAATPTIVYGLNGNDTIDATSMTANVWFVGGQGADTITGGTGVNRFLYGSAGESNPSGKDTITNFHTTSATGADNDGKNDIVDLSGITFAGSVTIGANTISSGKISADSIGWIQNGSETDIYVNTTTNQKSLTSASMEIVLQNFTASWLSASNFSYTGHVIPAGVAGAPINLALTNPAADQNADITVTITDMPAAWVLDGGKQNADGSWTVQTSDLSSLAVTAPLDFAGATVLNVMETWANRDGSTSLVHVADNVEAYAPGNPIFALPGEDNLTGSAGDDLFVVGADLGNDTIYDFNATTDKIDLVGLKLTSFGDLHIADDGNGDALIAVGPGETIALHGVATALLHPSDFLFDQAPTVDNTGTMSIGAGAVLPLGGMIDNTGTIALNSTGQQAELELVGNSVVLAGGGQVTLASDALVAGTGATSTLTNVDNTISGAGQIGIGDGTLSLVNAAHGTVDANIAGALLALDTGTTIENLGLLEASNGGSLVVADEVSNSGTLAAHGGTLHFENAVVNSAAGNAVIAGGVLEFDTGANVNVCFDNGQNGTSYGELVLSDAAQFTGDISGFAGAAPDQAHSDVIDLAEIDFNSAQFAATYHAATGVLSVTDGAHSADLTFDNFQGALNFVSDGHGGTAITDAPANASADLLSADTVQGMLLFADNDASTDLGAAVTPEGQNYVGSLTAGTVSESNGIAAVDYGFVLGNDRIDLASGRTVTQSYQVSLTDTQNPVANASQTVAVTIGGSGSDNFVFAPGIGADTVLNFDAPHDTIELDHFVNVQTVQELQDLITTNAPGDAFIDLGNHDSITVAGVTAAQLQQVVQSGHVLLH